MQEWIQNTLSSPNSYISVLLYQVTKNKGVGRSKWPRLNHHTVQRSIRDQVAGYGDGWGATSFWERGWSPEVSIQGSGSAKLLSRTSRLSYYTHVLRVIARVHGLIVVWPNHWCRPELARASSPSPWTSAITLLLYTSSHVLEMFWIILGVVLGPITPKKTVFWQLIPAENGLIICVTIPIAI